MVVSRTLIGCRLAFAFNLAIIMNKVRCFKYFCGWFNVEMKSLIPESYCCIETM